MVDSVAGYLLISEVWGVGSGSVFPFPAFMLSQANQLLVKAAFLIDRQKSHSGKKANKFKF